MTSKEIDSYGSTVLDRTRLTFCMAGLKPREALLIKSFVRLLDHLTHQQWSYQQPDGLAHIDLLVAARGSSEAFLASYGKLPSALLELNYSGDIGPGHLPWPLKPELLEKELNRLGGLVMPRLIPVNAFDILPLYPVTATSQTKEPEGTALQMCIQVWPPSRLLASPGRLRLATLLTGKPMTIAELVERSDLPRVTCQAFLTDLQVAGILLYLTPSQSPAMADSLVTGNQGEAFGPSQVKATSDDFNRSPSTRPDHHVARMPIPATVSSGLLARIRRRLGIGDLMPFPHQ